jgi:hypothetical protein
MPKTPIDYSKTVVYKIVCNDLNILDSYIGSTTDFTRRKSSHKSSCKNENEKLYGKNLYKVIRENGGWENWSMIEIEKYDCKDGNEKSKKERYWYDELKPTLNLNKPDRARGEWRMDNREHYLNLKKKYNSNERKKIETKEKEKSYREKNKEKTKAYNKKYKEEHKKKLQNTFSP